ncbi:PAS fold-containing protein [Amycolatopsis xylanica]|uniref:PAS fold-containing protein n=1 Tax=Amycolatopsis xylanica TaxID=589385 RepID=A0A1H3SAQ1_9PSEU|nr:ANTAR domain-containing protein [Amycolatopsis xylanica]SDZ35072.1 PAS fold-containing protein [Amycolatopsis xylanica]
MSTSAAPLARIGADPAFVTTAAPYLILDTDLRIRAANPAYTSATLTTAGDLVGSYLFDAFPDNPDDPGADGVANLADSLEQVLRHGQRHDMGLQRYDVPSPDDRHRFVRKIWAPLNVPLRDADDMTIGILHHVEDITDIDHIIGAPTEEPRGTEWWQAHPQELTQALRAVSRLNHAHRAVLRENHHLREALRTRGVIEQAKGILIGQRRCQPDDAFAILVGLSQDTNTKLHDVAKALVADTLHHRETQPGPTW